MKLTEQTWVDVQASNVGICLLPIRSVEQHGPHTPLGTGVRVADAVVAAVERVEACQLPPKHAGSVETSVLLHLVPAFLDIPQAGDIDSWNEWVHGAQVAKYTDEFTENGVLGSPTTAIAKDSQELFETAVGELHGLIEWLQDRTVRSNDRQIDREREYQ